MVKTTGLEKESFDILFEFLYPGENSCKLNYCDNAISRSEQLQT